MIQEPPSSSEEEQEEITALWDKFSVLFTKVLPNAANLYYRSKLEVEPDPANSIGHPLRIHLEVTRVDRGRGTATIREFLLLHYPQMELLLVTYQPSRKVNKVEIVGPVYFPELLSLRVRAHNVSRAIMIWLDQQEKERELDATI